MREPPDYRDFAGEDRDGSSVVVTIRIIVLTWAGAFTGWVSGVVLGFLERRGTSEWWDASWPPGFFYAALWWGVSWLPRGLVVRESVRRTPFWNLIFVGGIIMSYSAAYFVTFNSVVRIDGIGVLSEVGLWALSGGLGGLVGSLGLVSLWAIWFPMAEPWPTRVGLVLCGCVLGTSLTLWKEDFNPGKAKGFFVLWQAGMAAALATADALGRSRSLENAPKC